MSGEHSIKTWCAVLTVTEQGEVFVKLSLETGAGGINCLRTEICDTGPGMSAEGKQRLFKSFSQVDNIINQRLTVRMVEKLGTTRRWPKRDWRRSKRQSIPSMT